ncbi:MAG: hypothetical protein DWH79_03810 [Planctomycetota bacterium]|nr:MAG: hypothetical protein DWH79_03810 [Planctomycetota bacterium]
MTESTEHSTSAGGPARSAPDAPAWQAGRSAAGGRVGVQGDGVIHEIRWSDALPWWLLFRAAGAAFSPAVVMLAALGALSTWAGWSVADRIGLADGRLVATAADLVSTSSVLGGDRGDTLLATAGPVRLATDIVRNPLEGWDVGVAAVWAWLPEPAADLVRLLSVPLSPSATFAQMLGTSVRLAWFVAVWSIFGTAIARQVALRLAGEEAPGLTGGLWFGSKKWLSAFNSAAFVLLGLSVLCIPGAGLGLLMRSDIGLAVAGAIWPLVLIGGIVLAILAIGVVAGWPLMVGGVGVERGDSFQAISTAFSYLYQRPLHYIFYLLVALAVSLPALAAAHLFATATSNLTLWAASLGMGHDRTTEVLSGLQGLASGNSVPWGIKALGFWIRGLEAVLGSFGWGYFWAISTAAYLLLRRDVDGTELDEVVIDELPGDSE